MYGVEGYDDKMKSMVLFGDISFAKAASFIALMKNYKRFMVNKVICVLDQFEWQYFVMTKKPGVNVPILRDSMVDVARNRVIDKIHVAVSPSVVGKKGTPFEATPLGDSVFVPTNYGSDMHWRFGFCSKNICNTLDKVPIDPHQSDLILPYTINRRNARIVKTFYPGCKQTVPFNETNLEIDFDKLLEAMGSPLAKRDFVLLNAPASMAFFPSKTDAYYTYKVSISFRLRYFVYFTLSGLCYDLDW